ncbi:MAG: HAD-IIA family hydrolase [Erysipelotrichaceae bacterium]
MKLLFDLDGTLYHGTKVVSEAIELINHLHKTKQQFGFITNNSSRTPLENVQHMEKLGFSNIKPEQFFNSAIACVAYLKENITGNKVHVIGKNGLRSELLNNGYDIVDEYADIVVVGSNGDANYLDYSLGCRNLYQGAKLVGTNNDRIFMSEDGIKCGTGAVVNMLAYSANQTPIITGKPTKIYIDYALKHFGYQSSEVMIVGDNLETDILCGINSGIKTCLVLGGTHNQEDIERLNIKPSMIINDLSKLI